MKISTILDHIDSGHMALPEFQRGYVWNRDQVRGLFDSLYRRHPVGGLLVWATESKTATHRGDGALHVVLGVDDDRLDALAMLVAKFVESMNTSVEAAMKKRQEDILMHELKLFTSHGGRHAGGLAVTLGAPMPTKGKTWASLRGRG